MKTRFRQVARVAVISTGHIIHSDPVQVTSNNNGEVTMKSVTLSAAQLRTKFFLVRRVVVSANLNGGTSAEPALLYVDGASVASRNTANAAYDYSWAVDLNPASAHTISIAMNSDGSANMTAKDFTVTASIVEWYG